MWTPELKSSQEKNKQGSWDGKEMRRLHDGSSCWDRREARETELQKQLLGLQRPGYICHSFRHQISLPIPSACFPTRCGWKWTFLKFASGTPRALSSAQPPSTCKKPVTRGKWTAFCEAPGDIIVQTKKGRWMSVWSSETHLIRVTSRTGTED